MSVMNIKERVAEIRRRQRGGSEMVTLVMVSRDQPRCPDCNRLMQPNDLGPWRPPWYVCPWRSEEGTAHMPRYEQQQWPRKRRGAKR